MKNYYGNLHWRGSFFNNLIKNLNYKNYLELGVSTGEYSYNLIECENKIGVDSNPNINLPNVECLTTDDYFKNLSDNVMYDLIYIDAYHEKYQVYKDFCNSIRHLKVGGLIVFHDIFPLTEDYSSQSFNGDCYQTWIELVKKYPENTDTFIGYPGDPEGTVGIFLKTEDFFYPQRIQKIEYTYQYFIDNLPRYIYNKVITEDQIILKTKMY